MSTPIPNPAAPLDPETVKADPKRPWKAYIATAVLLFGTIWSNLDGVEDWSTLDFRDWCTIIVPTVLGFLLTYFVENPKIVVPAAGARGLTGRGEGGYTSNAVITGIVVIVALIVFFALILPAMRGS